MYYEHIINDSSEKKVVLSGAGTGKTTLFKEVVHSVDESKKILILSFINRLVNDLKSEFTDYSNNVDVLTLHKFATSKLRHSLEERGESLLIDNNLDDIISEDYRIINGGEVNFHQILSKLEIDSDQDLLDFYIKRKKFYAKKNEKLYSHNSVIYTLICTYRENENNIPQQYHYILVDEFQDFNLLEIELINLLAKKNKIIVVGDDDQSLYHWRYASPDVIRNLCSVPNIEWKNFEIPYCFRCTKVIVNVVNKVILNAKNDGLFINRAEKKYEYPEGFVPDKDKISNIFNKIQCFRGLSGDQVFYHLVKKIREDVNGESKKIIILCPGFMLEKVVNGLKGKGLTINSKLVSKDKDLDSLIKVFNILKKTKTNNLALRSILNVYVKPDRIKEILLNNKGIWFCLSDEEKKLIQDDIGIFEKYSASKVSTELSPEERNRFHTIFNFDKLINYKIKEISETKNFQKKQGEGSISVEVMSVSDSKGLSADFVYFLNFDNKFLFTGRNESGEKIMRDIDVCSVIVGMTRAREKLIIFCKDSQNNKFLDFIESENCEFCS